MQLFMSRHQAQKAWLRRRTFLKAMALGIAAPLADQMSKLAVAQVGSRPNRLFILFMPHGSPNEHYEVGESLDLARSGEGTFSPLEPYKKYLQVIRGLGIYTAENHDAIRSVLTGRDGDDSIDYQIATALGTTAHVLGVQSYRKNSAGLDHDAQLVHHGGWVTPVQNPAKALSDLFAGLGAEGADPNEVVDEAEFRKEALLLTEGEVAAMQSALKGLTNEENKLQIHLESLRSVRAAGDGQGSGAVGCSTRPALPTAEGLAGLDEWSAANFAAVLDGHLEASAQALLCGSARIITLQIMHANGQIPMDFAGGPGVSKNHHDPISHSWDTAGRAEFARVQKWFYSRLADKFLAALDQPDPLDPAHTALDNCTILTTTEIADGAQHNSRPAEVWLDGKANQSYMPWLLIGGGGGYFGGGRAVTVAQGEDHRNLHATIAASMGVPMSTFGGLNTTEITGLKA